MKKLSLNAYKYSKQGIGGKCERVWNISLEIEETNKLVWVGEVNQSVVKPVHSSCKGPKFRSIPHIMELIIAP